MGVKDEYDEYCTSAPYVSGVMTTLCTGECVVVNDSAAAGDVAPFLTSANDPVYKVLLVSCNSLNPSEKSVLFASKTGTSADKLPLRVTCSASGMSLYRVYVITTLLLDGTACIFAIVLAASVVNETENSGDSRPDVLLINLTPPVYDVEGSKFRNLNCIAIMFESEMSTVFSADSMMFKFYL